VDGDLNGESSLNGAVNKDNNILNSDIFLENKSDESDKSKELGDLKYPDSTFVDIKNDINNEEGSGLEKEKNSFSNIFEDENSNDIFS
jgi:hypothetical protein